MQCAHAEFWGIIELQTPMRTRPVRATPKIGLQVKNYHPNFHAITYLTLSPSLSIVMLHLRTYNPRSPHSCTCGTDLQSCTPNSPSIHFANNVANQ
eukprot:1158709-Pelagomonas_calceolata.AAC.2